MNLRRRSRHRSRHIDPELEFFSGLSVRQLRRIEELLTIVDVPSGRSLGLQGQIGREFIVVLAGKVSVSVHGTPLAVLHDGHHFGALPLLDPLGSPRRRASFHPLVLTSVGVASRQEFNAMRRDVPVIDDRIRRLADKRQAYFDGVEAGRQEAEVNAAVDRFPVDVGEPVVARVGQSTARV